MRKIGEGERGHSAGSGWGVSVVSEGVWGRPCGEGDIWAKTWRWGGEPCGCLREELPRHETASTKALVQSGNSKEASVAGTEWDKGRVGGDKVREVMRGQREQKDATEVIFLLLSLEKICINLEILTICPLIGNLIFTDTMHIVIIQREQWWLFWKVQNLRMVTAVHTSFLSNAISPPIFYVH